MLQFCRFSRIYKTCIQISPSLACLISTGRPFPADRHLWRFRLDCGMLFLVWKVSYPVYLYRKKGDKIEWNLTQIVFEIFSWMLNV